MKGWDLKDQKGNWKPLELIWEESSGAVAPEFRYGKYYRLVTSKNKISLTRKQSRAGKQILNETKEISASNYESWMQKLYKTGIDSLTIEPSPEEKVTGVSYNFVSFQFTSTKSKFYYMLEDKKNPSWKQKNSIIEMIERMKP
ncbi:permease [Leptospira congkakensis]|uniref:Permease n=1 Tax=Leptospira congkakensis TaxID=2484932 RepID=A0A4Z1AFL4_9LEPT|nr:permease [Leptospira congkakensis]TGL86861.1 permease [Leptospira congkakensis]TGL93595.1 permease [Leptospira congkakensis]TGL95092.1 permease [Leptospira congkakensis]